MIPNVVHKVLFTDKLIFDQNIQNAQMTWTRMNPQHKLQIFNKTGAISRLKHHNMKDVIDAINAVRANSGKANLFRFAILWAEGGWYTDWKSECLEYNLLTHMARASHHSLVTCRDNGNAYSQKNFLYQTAFVGTPPHNPCIQKVIQEMLRHVRLKYYGTNPLDTTGPGVWGRVVNRSCTLHIQCEHTKNHYWWNGRPVARQKCTKCKKGQDWQFGNNYNTLWKQKRYYFDTPPSLSHMKESSKKQAMLSHSMHPKQKYQSFSHPQKKEKSHSKPAQHSQ